jgi:hypothetical protein
MVGSKNNEWGATRIWHGHAPRDTLPATAQPFFLFSVFAGLLPPFSPFFLAILVTYRIQAINLHPKSATLLAVFAYTCEARIGIKPSVAYFCHLFSLRSSGLNQSSGCVSFIATAGMEGDFIDLKWMKKVEDFQSCWFFVDILKESELFLVTGIPPVKLTTWASEALPEEALRTLRPRIRDLRKAGVTGTMVGVEFITRRIAPPTGPPPGDLEAQGRGQPQAPRQRAQRRCSGGGNKSLLLFRFHPRHPTQCPADLQSGRPGDQPCYGGDPEVQCLGPVP